MRSPKTSLLQVNVVVANLVLVVTPLQPLLAAPHVERLPCGVLVAEPTLLLVASAEAVAPVPLVAAGLPVAAAALGRVAVDGVQRNLGALAASPRACMRSVSSASRSLGLEMLPVADTIP